MALELDLNNSERQKIERVMSLDLETMVTESPDLLEGKRLFYLLLNGILELSLFFLQVSPSTTTGQQR